MTTLLRRLAKPVIVVAVLAAGAAVASMWNGTHEAGDPRRPRTTGPRAQPPGKPDDLAHPVTPPVPPPNLPAPPAPSPTRDWKQDPTMPASLVALLKGAVARGNAQAAATYSARLRELGDVAIPAIRAEWEKAGDPAVRDALGKLLPGK